ncbi:MAG TPA: DUF6159 family protein [Verrucomicrobiae bacterium]|nr:DUF6159 family protein [Verrucomicrobiae bacterium]
MDRIQRSWELFKSSLFVMKQNKTLLAFPILTSILTIMLVVLFLVPVAFRPTGHSYASAQHWKAVTAGIVDLDTQSPAQGDASNPSFHRGVRFGRNVKPIAAVYFAAMYFACMFLATFLNVAFYHEIMNALSGQPVSIAEGLSFAARKWKIILMWTLFAGLVGFIIKTLEERFGWFGEIIMRLIGTVWSIACVFVIPVIITEEGTSNPLVVLKKSAQTLTRTWGESLIGYAGVSLSSSVIMGISLVWLIGGLAAASFLHSILLAVFVVLSWLGALIVFSYLMSVASQIFRCALFLYASQGTLPHPYNEEMMSLAWKTKKS